MAKTTEERFTHKDIRRLSFACTRCGAETTADLGVELQRQYLADSRPAQHPSCGICRRDVEQDFGRALSSLVQALGEIDATGETVTFCIRPSEEGGE